MSRRSGNRKQKSKFLIFTNGKTEENYFNLLRKMFGPAYKVKVISCTNANPEELVDRAIKAKAPDVNAIWCVFDIDQFHKNGKVIPAYEKAMKEKIGIACSNVSFEVWLLCHFKECMRAMSEDELIRALEDHIRKVSNNKDFEFDKNDEEQLRKHFLDNHKTAMKNAKVVHQKQMKTHGIDDATHPICDWNPCTTAYQLIEALKLQKKL